MNQGLVVFPPRNEPNTFFQNLQLLYRDFLRRSQNAPTYVDPEGQNVWLTEYFRFYLNGCSHEEATARTLTEIATGAALPTCGSENLAFPPRNLPNDFQNRLEATYRDVLGRPQTLSYVDSEGANVWLAQYLRFRISGRCDHASAENKVFAEIRGQGVQPDCGPQNSFGPGQYFVGRDIAPGRYYTDPRTGCYWERQSGLGGQLSDVIANEFVGFDAGQWIVDILPSDLAFETDTDCGTWFNAPRRGHQATISPGMWLVGSQVSPGTYRALVRDGCYWERLRNFTGTLNGIIANDFVSGGGQQLIAIGSGDAGFSTDDDCGSWTSTGAQRPSDAGVRGEQSRVDIEQNRNLNRQGRPLR
jgi:hypothetical protein